MHRSLAAIVFIGAAAAAGVYVGTRTTVMRGDVLADRFLEEVKENGIVRIACDDRIPVTAAGAVFTCKFQRDDGATARFEYTMDRAGAVSEKRLDETPPTIEAPTPTPGTDTWGK
ncbi:MAG TPA: hypothetical protein VK427_02720 [Kofleriaceae bacterium]|nr:hypothetical protein [Kofleriaceae bacterium]